MLTRRERVRRVVIVCTSFVRNLAYFRAGKGSSGLPLLADAHPQASFWRQSNANFLDIAVLEWCKLFAEPRGEQGWRQIVADPMAFEAALLNHLGLTAPQFEAHVKAMRHYRDKFVAHLDSDPVMNIPMFTASEAANGFYHAHVAAMEANTGDLTPYPDTADKLKLQYVLYFEEAEAILTAANKGGTHVGG